MKDEITISLNGKTIGSFGIELVGTSQTIISRINSFKTTMGLCEGKRVLEIGLICVLDENHKNESVVAPIEPMVIRPIYVDPTPVQTQMESLAPDAKEEPVKEELPVKEDLVKDAPIVKTRKPRGQNKIPVEVKKEDVVVPVVSVPTVAPDIAPTPTLTLTPVSTSTTPARINELAKLVKMWSKASGLGIEYITIDRLKTEAFDIVENDSDETIIAGIEEAKRLIKG